MGRHSLHQPPRHAWARPRPWRPHSTQVAIALAFVVALIPAVTSDPSVRYVPVAPPAWVEPPVALEPVEPSAPPVPPLPATALPAVLPPVALDMPEWLAVSHVREGVVINKPPPATTELPRAS